MEFRILGPLEVVEQGKALPLGGPQQRAVLCLLLLRANEAVASERLIDELWGERPPATAAKTLRVYVSRLRKLLGDRLLSRAPGYLVQVEEDELDLSRFQRLRERARGLEPGAAAETLNRALELWRGPPLADFAYEPWAQGEIARLEELRLVCLEERLEADLALGRHAELVGELEALVARFPLRERLRAQLMLALYRSGRQAEALQAYQAARSVLVEELGIDPSPELQRLEKAILVQDPALAPPPPAPEPPPAHAEPTPVAAPAREARKSVTVVFVDLADSTALGEELDPEAFRSVQSRYFDAVAPVLRRHGGTVEKFIGDAVMCVFGLPTVHEDDALRAVRGAVEATEAIERLSGELQPSLGVRLEVAIGINSGEVAAGEAATGEHLVTGDAVNVAAGLQQAAEAGEILLGERTHRLVRDAVRVEAAEPLALKRRRQPVRAFRLLELVPGAAPFTRRLDAPLVGREQELAQLRKAFERASRDRRAFLFTILGPAGIGKSRLAAELAAVLADRATSLTGRCLSYGEGITYWPLAEMVRQAAGEETRAGLIELLAGADDAEAVAERVAEAIGLADGVGDGSEASWAVRRLFETLARNCPLVAVFEDIHWAEPTLLDLIEHVADLSRDAPMLLLCLARNELLDERPGWAGGKLNASTMLLEPLSEHDCVVLIDELAPQGLEARARGRIVHASEGNPLFVEQMLALLAEGGEDAALPPTIESLLAARLDRLPDAERDVLERAAVEGTQFHLGGLTALLGGSDDLPARVTALVRKELVRPDRPTLPGEEAFRFRHVLLRDAAYGAVPKALRADLHERFASWFEGKTADRAVEYDEIVGYHLEQAARYRRELGRTDAGTGRLASAAAERLTASGRRARARGDSPAAANLLSRARELLPADEPLRLELAIDLGNALIDVGELDPAMEVLREAEREAATVGDERIQAHASLMRLLAEMYQEPEGKTDAAYAEGTRAMPLFRRHGDDLGLARAWRLVADSHALKGRIGELEDAARQMEEHAGRAEDGQLRQQGTSYRTGAIVFGPRPVREGIALLEELLAQPSELRRREPAVLKDLALLCAMDGDVPRARELAARAMELTEELGLPLAQVLSRNRAGLVELLAGEPGAAERAFRRACEDLQRMRERSYLSNEAARLGEALVELGRLDEAEEATRLSEETAASDDVMSQVVWQGVRALVLAERGELETAERLARGAVALVAATDFLDLHADALRRLAVVLRAAGRIAEARSVAEEALRLHAQKGNILSAARARALLEELVSARGAAS